jgi:hypothetical protein
MNDDKINRAYGAHGREHNAQRQGLRLRREVRSLPAAESNEYFE